MVDVITIVLIPSALITARVTMAITGPDQEITSA